MSPCHYCGTPVDPDSPRTYQRVRAWERKASVHTSRRGGSDVVLRQKVAEFACSFCVDQARKGLAPTQESLI